MGTQLKKNQGVRSSVIYHAWNYEAAAMADSLGEIMEGRPMGLALQAMAIVLHDLILQATEANGGTFDTHQEAIVSVLMDRVQELKEFGDRMVAREAARG